MSIPRPLSRSVTVPPAAESVAAVRRNVREWLRAADIDEDTADTAVLLASEIVTNAVLHANTPVSVTVTVGAGVLVEVIDGSPLLPRPRRHDVESVTGRGLELVELLATRYGTRALSGGGKGVWFTVGETPAPGDAGWSEPLADDLCAVLVGLPVGLYEVLQEHNEALLREYGLHRLAESDRPGFTPHEVAAAARARLRIAAAFTRARSRGDRSAHLDVLVTGRADELAAFQLLPKVFADAERVAAHGGLLTRPALPELRSLRDWIFREVLAQFTSVAPPTRWEPAGWDQAAELPPATVDVGWVAGSDRAVVVADDGNRILAVSPAAAELLGWAAGELVGNRLTAIVPESFREAHVTGFTRQLVTGRDTILGRDLALAALRRDGQEVSVTLRLERHHAGPRTVFLGWLEPRPVQRDVATSSGSRRLPAVSADKDAGDDEAPAAGAGAGVVAGEGFEPS